MRANVKTHLVHPHGRERSAFSKTRYTLCSHTRTQTRVRARVQDSYGATNDWNDLHSMSNRRSLSVFLLLRLPPAVCSVSLGSRLSSIVDPNSTFASRLLSAAAAALARVTFSEGGAGLI